jgi:hypothetical protein
MGRRRESVRSSANLVERHARDSQLINRRGPRPFGIASILACMAACALRVFCPVTDISARSTPADLRGPFEWQGIPGRPAIEVGPRVR